MSASTGIVYVKSVYISDFQSHQETKIELAPPGGLTILVGPTDSGKTAVVRGARLLYYNSPSGIEFIRVGRNMATVALEMSDGTKVARERSKSVNRYRIVRPGQPSQVFEGFGLSVPQEVQEVTGVRTVSIGDSLDLALNLSEQLDGPFLGNKTVTGPTRAKILGSLAGTEEVDLANTSLGTDIHRAGQDVSRLSDEITGLDKRIAEYDYLPELGERITKLEAILSKVRELQTKLSALEAHRDNLAAIYAAQAAAIKALSRWYCLEGAAGYAQAAEGALAKMQALDGYRNTLASIHEQFNRWFPIAHIRWAGLEAGIQAHAEAEQSWTRAKTLAGYAADLLTTKEGILRCEIVLARWANLAAAEVAASSTNDALTRLQALASHRAVLRRIHDDMSGAIEVQARWHSLADAMAVASSIPEVIDRLAVLIRASASLTALRQARVVAEQDLSRHSKVLTDAQSLYADTLVAMKVCPLCGSIVDPESISVHIKEVA